MNYVLAMKNFILLTALILVLSGLAKAQENNPYQIGPVWGRKSYTHESVTKISPNIREQAKAVARFDGGTAFYLGKFDGKHLMATNHHVLPGALKCYSFNWVSFILIDDFFSCKNFIATFSDVELTIFELKVKPEDEIALKGLGIKLLDSPKDTERLYGIGYGFQNNPMRKSLLVSDDEHCKFFSSETRYIKDPDTINTANYQVWSRPVGCDFSHGDSGSPVLNELGEFVGINWTGGAPKPSKVQDSRYLDEILGSQDPEIWENLSYIVPVDRLREQLIEYVAQNPAGPYSQALSELLRQ